MRCRGPLPEEVLVSHFRREEVVPHLRLPLVLDFAGGGAGLLLGHSGRSKRRGILKGWRVLHARRILGENAIAISHPANPQPMADCDPLGKAKAIPTSEPGPPSEPLGL